MEYKKSSGTSGIEGQFYETKLLALILFRLQHDDRIDDFYLGTNMNDKGNLDDICIVIKTKAQIRPIALFIQLKHKESDEAYLTLDTKIKTKYIESFLKIKQMAWQKDCIRLFSENNTESDCLFILYTNVKFRYTNLISEFTYKHSSLIHDLIATSDTVGYQLQYSEKDFGENVLLLLAQRFAKFLNIKGHAMNIMNDEYIQQYHIILKHKVVDVSNVEIDQDKPDEKWRTITFKHSFFNNNDKYIVLLRDHLCREILKKLRNNINANMKATHAVSPEQTVDELISSFLTNPTAASLTPLIGTHITYNEDGKLNFLIKRSPDIRKQLAIINISQQTINEAKHAANLTAEEYLRSLKLKVPITFGNMDLAIRDNRLEYLVTAIISLCRKYKRIDSYKIVTIDENIDEGLFSLNGGLASAVGNFLIYDEVTNMFQLACDSTSLPNNAKSLLKTLTKRVRLVNEIDNLSEYRFDIKRKKFPKLQFDCANTAKEFLDKFVIYAEQSNQSEVEAILIQNIQSLLNTDHHNSLNSHSVFLHYHEEILKWWMTPKTGSSEYLTKAINLYERAINKIKEEPQLSDLSTTFYMNNLIYFKQSFSEFAIDEMQLPKVLSKVFIVTDTVALTTVKTIQYLRNRYSIDKYIVLDLECINNLSTGNFCALVQGLRKTEKVAIIVWHNNVQYCHMGTNRFRELAEATDGKQSIVITDSGCREKIKDYFLCSSDIFKYEIETLSAIVSHRKIMNDAKVIFQGREVSFNLILDEESVTFVRGRILDKVIRNETIHIGTPLGDFRYDEIKDLYIDRKLKPIRDPIDGVTSRAKLVNKFHDIDALVVLVTADPGIGKSTLLTHLSLNTKEHDIRLWIVRVNFLDHSKQFHKWQDDNTFVNDLESLKFLCQLIVKDRNVTFDVEILNYNARLLHSAGDDLGVFELNMFLHFYNRSRVLFLFDGFDEICPYYKSKVIDFLSVVNNCLRKNKMWVTSRPYSDILPDLRGLLENIFTIERLDLLEQQSYLNKFWREKLKINELTDKQLQNLRAFVDNTLRSIFKACDWVQVIFNSFYDYVRPVLHQTQLKSLRTASNDGIEALSGIPLLLYFTADYFVDVVNFDELCNKTASNLDYLNQHNLYTLFIENKIKKILFQDKNRMNLSNPFTRGMYEKELVDCNNIHKKLAADHLLQNLFEVLQFEEFQGMEPLNEEERSSLLSKIKTGKDKSGVISYVTDHDVPVFLHRTFTEYFASEYVCDILRSNNFNLHKKSLWFYALHQLNRPVFDWIGIKKEVDEKLSDIYNEIEGIKVNHFNKMATMYEWHPTAVSLSSTTEDYEKCWSLAFIITQDIYAEDESVRRENIENLYISLLSEMKPNL